MVDAINGRAKLWSPFFSRYKVPEGAIEKLSFIRPNSIDLQYTLTYLIIA